MDSQDLYTDDMPIRIGSGLVDCFQGLLLYTKSELYLKGSLIPEDSLVIVEGCYMTNQETFIRCKYEGKSIDFKPLNLISK